VVEREGGENGLDRARRSQERDNDAPSKAHENVVTGGQLGKFPARTVVTLDYALKAAKAFFGDGSPTSELDWISE
jgi:hypothetical protein